MVYLYKNKKGKQRKVRSNNSLKPATSPVRGVVL